MSLAEHEIMEFLPWAQRFARSCAAKLPTHLDRDDLQSAGVLGFLRAANRYDGKKGASFHGFCAVRIRGAVLDELRKWDWAPRSVHRNYRRITRVTARLTEQLEHYLKEIPLREIAAMLTVTPARVSQLHHQALGRLRLMLQPS